MPFVQRCDPQQSPVLVKSVNRVPRRLEDREPFRSESPKVAQHSSRSNRIVVFAVWYICLLTLLTVSAILV